MENFIWMSLKSKQEECKVKVHVDDNALCWLFRKSGISHSATLESNQILIALSDSKQIHVHYVQAIVNGDYVRHTREIITFHGSETDCNKLAGHIQTLVDKKEIHRPKRLLVFINPYCGSGDGVSRYWTFVAPLLQLYGVTAQVIETRDSKHASEVLADYDLSTIDVVVSMGGDGSFNQIVNGIIARTMKDSGEMLEHESGRHVKPTVALAMLPAGTGNVIALAAYSTLDLEACTLIIIQGKRSKFDTLAVHDPERWRTSSAGCASYGILMHIVMHLENYRWLGKSRYILISWMIWLYGRAQELHIDYLPYEDDGSSSISTDTGHIPIKDGPAPGWKSINIRSVDLQVMPWKMKDFICYWIDPKYQQPNLSEEKFALKIITEGSFLDIRRAIYRYSQKLVIEIPIRACRIRADEAGVFGPVISCDGEKIVLKKVDLRVRLHTDSFDIITLDEQQVLNTRCYSGKQ